MPSKHILFALFIGGFYDVATSSPVSASGYDVMNTLRPRQDPPLVVSGASGGVHPRQEIRTLQADNPDLWNLFLAAIQRWQATDQATKTSYFQVAGIHGQPYIPWDGVLSSGNPNVGYCTHSSNLFATWHRPYLALVEQLLQAQALEIVNALPDGDTKTRFQGLASQLRLPYWDWALNVSPIMPTSVSSQTVPITYPNGTTATIANPLYQYTFNPSPADISSPYNVWNRTVRNPPDISDPSGSSDIALEESRLQSLMATNRPILYNILSQYQTFNQFSNTASGGTPTGNLEFIHNGIHGSFRPGHMASLRVSAFDPIFWLHHSNIDRFIALFQKMHPDTYVTPFVQSQPTYTIAAGIMQNASSPLEPFHKNSTGAFFSSNDVINTATFGYTYPELQGDPPNATVIAEINTLYAPSSATSKSKRLAFRSAPDMTYMAAIKAPKMALNGPYSIHIFVDEPSSNPSDWENDFGYAGAMYVMAQPGMVAGTVDSGTIVLTQKLRDSASRGVLGGLDLDSVVSHLKNRFHVRIEQNGVEVPRTQVPGLKVSMFSTTVEQPKSISEFPKWGGLTEHKEITDGFEPWGWSG